MNYIIFGGSGFIGTHLIRELKKIKNENDKIYNFDIVMCSGEESISGYDKQNDVEYFRLDVRNKITDHDFPFTESDIIFNLAAVHRTPGHEDKEYFETNIRGAENVVSFAEKYQIKRILFTSSIAVYGAMEDVKTENTLPTPNIPYGISKFVAEKIHIGWCEKDITRNLIILRPGIVYGRGEHGNMTRLYNGIKGRYYFYAGRKDTVKACIYVKELVGFMKYCMVDKSFNGHRVINCTFDPPFTIEQICEAMKESTDLKGRKILKINGNLLMFLARILGPVCGKKVGIHPNRVKKLMISTNVSGQKLREMGYKFRYSLNESFEDWFLDCNREGLF